MFPTFRVIIMKESFLIVVRSKKRQKITNDRMTQVSQAQESNERGWRLTSSAAPALDNGNWRRRDGFRRQTVLNSSRSNSENAVTECDGDANVHAALTMMQNNVPVENSCCLSRGAAHVQEIAESYTQEKKGKRIELEFDLLGYQYS